jgi:hypothetical protein
MEDFEALPPGLQTYIAHKASGVRALYEGLPTWLRKADEAVDAYRRAGGKDCPLGAQFCPGYKHTRECPLPRHSFLLIAPTTRSESRGSR